MNPIDVIKQADCLHDSHYYATEDKYGNKFYYCSDCKQAHDEVYDLLMTRKGRLELLKAFLVREGIDIPKRWV